MHELKVGPFPDAAWRPLFAALQARGLRYIVIGSLAERLRGRHDLQPRDCDLLIDGLPSLEPIAQLLVDLGYALESWGESVAPPLPLERLRGRFYLRAWRRESGRRLVVDLTYECAALSFEEAAADVVLCDGIPVISAAHAQGLATARAVEQSRAAGP